MSFGEEHQKIVRYELTGKEWLRKEDHHGRWINDAKLLAEQGWMVVDVKTHTPPGIAWGDKTVGNMWGLETIVVYQRHPDWRKWAAKASAEKSAEQALETKVKNEFEDSVADWLDE